MSISPLPETGPLLFAPLASDEAWGENVRKMFASNLRKALDGGGYPASTNGAATMLVSALKNRISISAAQKWLQGERMPDAPLLLELAILLRVSVDYLLRGESLLANEGAPSSKLTLLERAERLQIADQLVLLPRIACYSDKKDRKLIAFTKSWLSEKFPGVLYDDIDLLTASSDHMEPYIRNGDEIVFWRFPRHLEDNGVYLLQMRHGRLIRRIRQMVSSDEYEISCDNPRYPSEKVPYDTFPYPLTNAASGELAIVGKVLAVIGVMR
ncbi:MAG: S24/S26 family peptidase [Opitutaceae bacterium]|nr:S24/S26 family peptidase [Opitutaceae bacterium]